jgi:Sec-independent protein translocase protein TatA
MVPLLEGAIKELYMHFLDILIIVGVALAIFGPKTLQSLARDAGKSAAKAKQMKESLMSDLPINDISKLTKNIPQVPLNSRQALGMLMSSNAEMVEAVPDKKTSDTVKEGRTEPQV